MTDLGEAAVEVGDERVDVVVALGRQRELRLEGQVLLRLWWWLGMGVLVSVYDFVTAKSPRKRTLVQVKMSSSRTGAGWYDTTLFGSTMSTKGSSMARALMGVMSKP